jgi:MFS family permease
MGQTAFLLVISVFLQDSRHLSALDTGLWLVPSGVFIVVGAQLGGRLTRRIGTTSVVRAGLALEALGLAATAVVITPTVTFMALLPGFALFGVGIGFGGSQLTNVILSDIAPEKSGAASGANSTVRMIGSSLGVAIMSTLLGVLTVRYAVDAVEKSRNLARAVRTHAITSLHTNGVNFSPLKGTSARDASVLDHALGSAIASAARPPLIFATAVVTLGLLISFLIPSVGPVPEDAVSPQAAEAAREAELLAEAVTIQ